VDGRWLAWLDAQSSEAARALRRQIKQQLGATWASAAKLGPAEVAAIRREIIALAKSSEQGARE